MRTWYLPHDAVYRGEGEGRKCLVEFNGSARYGGTSLNVLQEAGLTIQTDLLGLSSGQGVGLQADIEKMYT
ncbi:hypothetical protein T01_13119 [Trichinella spiralis]|uniref:Uncharacterized protein n=1 Tax=Trichinella spiralis TaxID=6334 RepID=A0A0V1C006_TRISP|nr:hypothetical protein T01_13119 [Trichinella spiralis]